MANKPFFGTQFCKPTPTKKKKIFNPGRAEVQKAMQEFLNRGGRIQRIEIDEGDYIRALLLRDRGASVDDFLNGV